MPQLAFRYNPPALPPLPRTVTELTQGRKKPAYTLTGEVEQIHFVLYDGENNEKYRELILAAWNAQAVEGATNKNDSEEARMIRDYAKDYGGYTMTSNANLHSISKALNVIKRRDGIDRKSLKRAALMPDTEETADVVE